MDISLSCLDIRRATHASPVTPHYGAYSVMYCLPGMVRFSCFIDVLQGFTAILYFNISIANSFGEFSRPNLFWERVLVQFIRKGYSYILNINEQ